jgi:hypothetical protein
MTNFLSILGIVVSAKTMDDIKPLTNKERLSVWQEKMRQEAEREAQLVEREDYLRVHAP